MRATSADHSDRSPQVKDLLGAIPAHCYERNGWRSFSYVVMDFIMIGSIMYAASFIDPNFGAKGSVLAGAPGVAAKWALWTAYWTMAGWNFTGIWIIAHECAYLVFSRLGSAPNAPRRRPGRQQTCRCGLAWRRTGASENASLTCLMCLQVATRHSAPPRRSTTPWASFFTRSSSSRTTRGAFRTPSTTYAPVLASFQSRG